MTIPDHFRYMSPEDARELLKRPPRCETGPWADEEEPGTPALDAAIARSKQPLTWRHVLLAALVLTASAAVVLWVALSLGPGG